VGAARVLRRVTGFWPSVACFARDLDHGRPSISRLVSSAWTMVRSSNNREINMTDHVETFADLNAASVTSSRELSEAELSTVAGALREKLRSIRFP
jgi:hypothetical protein